MAGQPPPLPTHPNIQTRKQLTAPELGMRKQKHQNQEKETENQCLKHAADTPHTEGICRELLLNQWTNAGIKMAYIE